ncbi:TetR/AcrR family transcriptional regulator [Bacillus sp. CGMCC 1.16541]|uniref:TetR/AcrR family transcriptional regulator n=1 Tax=Bacillus sp. CGMCC 1.16541 TaxID=2185143 RepID=UPI000D738B65|nr:TetR/AcrR family transcriptional regulator [Bacillus sp. CGMCC 1.16541]
MRTTPSKRDSILSSALFLFAERGFDATTIPMIATSAGVGAGTIYRYFENKEVLVNELFQQYVETFTHTIQAEFPYDGEIRKQFQYIFNAMIQFTTENSHALYFIRMHSDAHFLTKESRDCFTQLLTIFITFFDEGKKQCKIKDLPSSVLMAIMYGAFLELQRLVRSGEIEPESHLLTQVEESFWDAVRLHQ